MPRLANAKGRRSSLAAPAPVSPRQSTSASTSSNPRARLGVLAAAQSRHHRDSLGGSGGPAGQRNVSGVLGAAPLVVESQRYEEWMKIATDNVSPVLLALSTGADGAMLTPVPGCERNRKSRRPTPGTWR